MVAAATRALAAHVTEDLPQARRHTRLVACSWLAAWAWLRWRLTACLAWLTRAVVMTCRVGLFLRLVLLPLPSECGR